MRPESGLTEIVISETPSRMSWRMRTSRIGRSLSGMSGFGRTVVYGARRGPRPPAMITACIGGSDRVRAAGGGQLGRPHPVDHSSQPVLERRLRRPARRLAQARRVTQELVDLAALGPQALRLGVHGELPAEQPADHLDD